MRDIKQASSKWVHETIGLKVFAWQDGYGAFNVGASQLADVKNYISSQVQHHRKRTFQEEYLIFLKRYEIEYDEKYVW